MQEKDSEYTPIDISTILLNPTELYFMKSNETFGVMACFFDREVERLYKEKTVYHTTYYTIARSEQFGVVI